MNMTHYMELLAQNQPWNLIIFMAVPVVCAETAAVAELLALAQNLPESSPLCALRRAASFAGAVWMAGILAYLAPNVLWPLASLGAWRGASDAVAVSGYALSLIPFILLALPAVQKDNPKAKLRRAGLLCAFLVLAHVAMIFGMAEPAAPAGASAHGPGAEEPAGMPAHAGHSR